MRLLSKFGVELHQSLLKNDVNVFLFYRKGMPIFLRTLFFAGSRFDTISGTAHFLEHLITSGTEKFPSKNIIADHIQKIGGEFGASTGIGLLSFDVEIPESEDIDIGIEVLKECITKSLFDLKTIENERGAILAELKGKKSNPKSYVVEVKRRLILQGSPAGRSTLGTEESIGLITKENLLSFKKDFLHTGRMCFVVSGDIDINLLTGKLNNIDFEKGPQFVVDQKIPIVFDKKTDVEYYPGANIHAILSCRTDMNNFKEYCTLKVLNNILAVGRGSRLVTVLRYKNGLVYSISGSISYSVDWSSINIEFACDKENFSKATDLIYQEFKNLIASGISETELENTKSKISKGSVRKLQSSVSWVNAHENTCLLEPGNPKTTEDYINTIQLLTKADIDAVARKYLEKENFYTAICGDYKSN